MASVSKNSLDLEVKHASNGSWHPCRVSLRSDNAKIGIIVNFENSEEEEMMYDKEEALTRLRFRSAPLRNSECSLINKGDSVLALYKDQYFDAVIEKPHRVKHSNRVSCRCNFEIKLQNSKLRGKTMTVPSKSISKLSSEEIVSDTIFTSFLNALDPNNATKSPSSLFCDDDADVEGEIDIDGMLDKQIEQISESVNCHTKNFEDKKATFGSQGISKRSTRSQKKQKTEKNSKNGREEDKTFLSPLAARAALASLFHDKELPVKENYLSIPMEKLRHDEPFQKGASSDRKVKTPVRVTRSRENNISQESTSRTARNSKSKEVEVSESVAKSVVNEVETYSSLLNASATTPASNGQRKENTGRPTHSSGSKGIKILSDKEKSGPSKGKIVSPDNTRKTRFSISKEVVEVLENEAKKESPSVEKFASPIHGKNYGNSKTRTTRSSITDSLPDEAFENSTGEKLTSPSARLTRSRDKELHTDYEDVTPNKKMRTLALPTGTSDKSDGNMEETSGKKRKSARQKEISQKPQLRSSPRFKSSAKA